MSHRPSQKNNSSARAKLSDWTDLRQRKGELGAARSRTEATLGEVTSQMQGRTDALLGGAHKGSREEMWSLLSYVRVI